MFGHLLNGYTIVFGLMTVILESDPDVVPALPGMRDAAPHLIRIQAYLHDKVQLLTEFHGRAWFYVYQGTLLITQDCTMCLLFALGLYNILMGGSCSLMALEYARKQTLEDDDKLERGTLGTATLSHDELRRLEKDFGAARTAYLREEKSLKGRARMDLYGLLQQ